MNNIMRFLLWFVPSFLIVLFLFDLVTHPVVRAFIVAFVLSVLVNKDV